MNLAVMLSRYSGTHRKTMAEPISRTTSSRNENRRAHGPRYYACYDVGNSAHFISRYLSFTFSLLSRQVSSYVTTPFFRVRNLTVGSMYEFRVMAENQYGTSDPVTTMDPIKARHPFDPPGAPGTPKGVETTEDSITITWTKPRHDGGSPILGYVIEKRLLSEDKWVKATPSLVHETNYR